METNVVEVETPESTQTSELTDIERKTKLTGTVIKTTLAGAVVDVGLETPGVVHISQLQAKPVNRVEDVVNTGDTVQVWVRRVVPKKKRLELTMIKPLDLEWREIKPDMVLKGKVVRLEKFGAFVEIGAERPGLVHISEMTHDYIKSPGDVVKEGDEIEVKVLSVNRQKKQIKLSMKALEEAPVKEEPKQAKSKSKSKKSSDIPEEKEEAVPTAMEMALRQAMERSQDQQDEEEAVAEEKSREIEETNTELEQILERTLKNKVRSR